MSKEKVFIVVSHKNSPKAGSHPGRGAKSKLEWEVSETVEFVNQVKNRHTDTASIIGDYINRKIIIGSRFGITEYAQLDEYVRKKYKKQMDQLDEAYGRQQVADESPELVVDASGNLRAKTVFDV